MTLLWQTILGGNAALALGSAINWGAGDFAGGMGVKRAGGSFPAALRVVLLSHGMSLLGLLVIASLRGDSFPHGAPLIWGLTAGLFGCTSVLTFYVCLASGTMGASAAISGLLAAAIPAAVSIVLEGAPGMLRLAGFLLAAVAIWLIASSPGAEAVPGRTLALAIFSGAGFGVYFVALRMAGAAGIVYPLALSRSVSVCLCCLCLAWMATARGRKIAAGLARPRITRTVVAWAIGTALLDTGGNLFFIAATRAGRLDVAAVLASLYPATTILLAAWLLRERPSARQGAGMALAAAAVVLITV